MNNDEVLLRTTVYIFTVFLKLFYFSYLFIYLFIFFFSAK